MDSTEKQPIPQGAAVLKTLPLERIRIDADIQCRVRIDEPTVADYQHDIQAGTKLPPIDVFFDGVNEASGGVNWLADGFHRHLAHQRAGKARIACRVHRGTREDALWFAIGANQTHGLRRSNEDKDRAVRAALLHPKGSKLSDNQLAQHVGVSHPFVGKVRKSLEEAGQLETVTSRTGADGRTRNTSKIGRKTAKLADLEVRFPALRELPPEQRQAAYGRAVEVAGSTPSNVHVREVVDGWLAAPIEPDTPVEPEQADDLGACPTCGSTERRDDEQGVFCAKCLESLDGAPVGEQVADNADTMPAGFEPVTGQCLLGKAVRFDGRQVLRLSVAESRRHPGYWHAIMLEHRRVHEDDMEATVEQFGLTRPVHAVGIQTAIEMLLGDKHLAPADFNWTIECGETNDAYRELCDFEADDLYRDANAHWLGRRK